MQQLAFRSGHATAAQRQARSGISTPSRHASQPQPRRSTAAAAATTRDATGSCDRLFAVAGAAAASLMMLVASPSPVLAAEGERCTLAAFDNFASTRAKFSMEASSGAMGEALVDVRECSFQGADLNGRVLSGALMNGTDCRGCSIKRAEVSRTDMRGADLRDVVFEDSNLYGSLLNGADLRGATFENVILTNASFGKDESGNWAQLAGAHFEGALLSNSDVERLCANPTIDADVRKFELGCRGSK